MELNLQSKHAVMVFVLSNGAETISLSSF